MLRRALLAWPLLLPLTAAHAVAPAEPGTASLEFIQNKGQWDSRVRYEAALPAGRLFVLPAGLTYNFLDPSVLTHHHGGAAKPGAKDDIAGHAYTVHFEKASARATLTAETPTVGERNYFIGKDERHWASHVQAFRQLRYGSLWPGIDLTLYENVGQHLEYDVLLAPGANPARVALRYEGASSLNLDAAGNLVIKTTVGTTTELAPKAFQTTASGQRQPVACRYVLTGTTLTFALGAYDKTRALTIDPTVQFSTLTGSTADNWGFTAAYDDAGNLYSGGIVCDNRGGTYPATPGAYRTTFASIEDMAIMKFNTSANGSSARMWATYLGGISSDFPHSLVVNARNELVLLGSTSSTNYPTTTGALQRTFAGGSRLDPFSDGAPYDMPGGSDLVISRFSADGSALLASTYLGGTSNDGVVAPSGITGNYGDAFRSDVQLDGDGNVYIASATSSTNFPGLARGFRASYGGGTSDAVVCKLTADLSAVTWAGLLGGTSSDMAYCIQRDTQGRVFVCGSSVQINLNQSNNFPTTAGAYHTGFQGGGIDGFAARISADGRTLERSTFIGTPGYDQAQLLQLDALGNVYLFGQTLGAFPVTTGKYSNANGSLFIQKLNPDLTNSFYSTVFGNGAGTGAGPNLVPTAFLVDDCERIYISGWGGSVNDRNTGWLGGSTFGLPWTAGAMKTTTDGSDFYLAEFAPGMTGLDYATFFGQQGVPEHVDGGTSRFDKRGIVYQAVCASCGGSQGFPQPPGAGSYTIRNGSSNCNNGAFKMTFDVVTADPGPRRFVCADGTPVTLGGTPAGGVWAGPGVQAAPGGGYRFMPAAVGPGQYIITYTVATTGVCQSTRSVRYVVAPPVVPAMTTLPPQCVTMPSVALVATPAGGTFSGPGVSGGRFNPATAGAGTHTLTYTVVDSLGCGTTTQQVSVVNPNTISAGPDSTLCADLRQPFQLRGFSPAGGTWSGTGVTPSGFFTPPNTNNRGGVFSLTYTVTQGPCQSTAVRTIVLAPTSSQNVDLNLPVCAATPRYAGLAPFDCPLTPVLLAPRATYSWDFGDGSPLSTEATPMHRYATPGSYRIQLTARYGNCEVLTGFAPMEVGEVKMPNIITPNGDELNDTFKPIFSCLPASFEVYTRWGQRVYRTDEYHYDWNGGDLPSGVYYYLLRDTQDRRAKGWVEIRR
jgi:gliding motility-associated-like protein